MHPALAFVDGAWRHAAPAGAGPAVDVRALTWNVWFGEHALAARTDALLTELAHRRTDVIALQEVTPEVLERLLAEPWVRAAYQTSTAALTQGYDVVILSRLPVATVEVVPLPTRMGRRLVIARLACGLAVATVHLESMKDSAEARAAQLAVIQPYLARHHPDAALIGDMNFRPDDATETAALAPGFVDAWPALRPDDPGYTADGVRNLMRHHFKPRAEQKRIDRVFVHGRRWRARAIELVGTAPIDDAGTFVSDHFGLEVTLAAHR